MISVFEETASFQCSETERSNQGKRHSLFCIRIHAGELVSADQRS